MNLALWIAQGFLALLYGAAGSMKSFRTAQTREQMPWARDSSESLVKFIGAAELLGALGLVLPMLTGIQAWLAPTAALGLAMIQVLAIGMTHVPRKEYKAIPLNLALLALAVFVAVGRWSLFSSLGL